MNELEARYLKDNCFFLNEKGEYVSNIIDEKIWCYENEFGGLCDYKHIDFIKIQFGEKLLNKIEKMKITVREVGMHEFDVKLEWMYEGGKNWNESSISGEGLYELVSQAIVLASIYDFSL